MRLAAGVSGDLSVIYRCRRLTERSPYRLTMAPESSSDAWGGGPGGSAARCPCCRPALALMSLVLGLNLLADGLREQPLKD